MSVSQRLTRWLRGGLPTWYDPSYRPPSVSVESGLGYEPRRADFVAWYLAEVGAITRGDLRHPPRATWAQLSRVHEDAYLESLTEPEALTRAMGVPSWDLAIDELLMGMRLAVGGTIEATREALRREGPTLNLLGGFQHAHPARGGRLSIFNDVAIAAMEARAMGLEGRIGLLSLDAQAPAGTAACFQGRRGTWIGSLTGPGWEPLEGVEEEHLPEGCEDGPYLRALHALLARMPPCRLVFVVAGGDVLAGDRQGRLGLSEAGARHRDLVVAAALAGVPSVWLPGGGFQRQAWRVLAGTGLALALGSDEPIPQDAEPLRGRFDGIFQGLDPDELSADPTGLGEALGGDMGLCGGPQWLGYYSAEGLERAFREYGIIDHLRRLGYRGFEVRVEPGRPDGDRMELRGRYGEEDHVLIECVAGRERLGEEWMLYINWLSLRHPRAQFHPSRPRLPGQRVPGLGLAPEITEMLGLVARRLGLGGVWFRPAHLHVAYSGRRLWRFTDPERQGRFDALLRDFGHLPLRELSQAAEDGRLRLDGEPYVWEASDMVYRDGRNTPDAEWLARAEAVKAAARFSLVQETPGEE
ncbi:MAG: histone deacetylase [Alphaproteobacteria bacterium]|nr:histone deacetylase [Alphaproteobacteria bacterium]MCB9795093.1 histone deacetylase [Alphaproteobacteria bacterium]